METKYIVEYTCPDTDEMKQAKYGNLRAAESFAVCQDEVYCISGWEGSGSTWLEIKIDTKYPNPDLDYCLNR